jgi:hypothetical protein
MSNPFGEIGAICVSKNLRTLHADVPTSHNSKLTTRCSPLTTQSSFVKKQEKGILDRVKKIQKSPTLL